MGHECSGGGTACSLQLASTLLTLTFSSAPLLAHPTLLPTYPQMNAGIVLSYFNQRYFHDALSTVCEFIPQVRRAWGACVWGGVMCLLCVVLCVCCLRSAYAYA